MKAGETGEFELIERLTFHAKAGDGGVVLGIGDDAAGMTPSEGRLLLATCDAMVEGVHFHVDWMSAEQIGARAAAVNLSDIAAMGGIPRWALVSLAVSDETPVGLLEGVYRGMSDALGRYGATIVGGNTTRTGGELRVDLTMLGEVEPDLVLSRAGARAGDLLCVTGELGGAAAAVKMLLADNFCCADAKAGDAVVARLVAPSPRLEAGRILARSGAVTSCIDISDGLAGDMGHVSAQSGVEIIIEAGSIPLGLGVDEIGRGLGVEPLLLALQGGEDYELAFTLVPECRERVFDELTTTAGVAPVVVGTVGEGPVGVKIVDDGGERLDLGGGFTHFGG